MRHANLRSQSVAIDYLSSSKNFVVRRGRSPHLNPMKLMQVVNGHKLLEIGPINYKIKLFISAFVYCEFDWELDELEEFTDKLIEEGELSADQKDEFKEFVKEKIREQKKSNREAREARRKAIEEMSEEAKAAFENTRFYKFYPVHTPDTTDISNVKVLPCRLHLSTGLMARLMKCCDHQGQ